MTSIEEKISELTNSKDYFRNAALVNLKEPHEIDLMPF